MMMIKKIGLLSMMYLIMEKKKITLRSLGKMIKVKLKLNYVRNSRKENQISRR